MKKVYITGIAGLLGGNIAYLLRKDYCIAGADLAYVDIDGVQTEKYDMLNEELLERSITDFSPDILIHTVAAINVDQCEVNIDYAEKLNVILTKSIARICAEKHIKLIYISTDAVFDGEEEKLYDEDDYVNPINVYGKTKLDGENEVLKNNGNLVLRTNIYGFNIQEKVSFGEWILYSLLNNQTITMFKDIYFSPILVNELADIISKAIEKELKGLYHACGSGVISKYDYAILLKQIFNIRTGEIKESSSDLYTFKAKRAKNMSMSNKKICENLGIRIRTPKEGLEYFKILYDDNYPNVLKICGRSEDENKSRENSNSQ